MLVDRDAEALVGRVGPSPHLDRRRAGHRARLDGPPRLAGPRPGDAAARRGPRAGALGRARSSWWRWCCRRNAASCRVAEKLGCGRAGRPPTPACRTCSIGSLTLQPRVRADLARPRPTADCPPGLQVIRRITTVIASPISGSAIGGAERDRGGAGDDGEADVGVGAGVVAVGDQRRAVEPAAGPGADVGRDPVAGEADQPRRRQPDRAASGSAGRSAGDGLEAGDAGRDEDRERRRRARRAARPGRSAAGRRRRAGSRWRRRRSCGSGRRAARPSRWRGRSRAARARWPPSTSQREPTARAPRASA